MFKVTSSSWRGKSRPRKRSKTSDTPVFRSNPRKGCEPSLSLSPFPNKIIHSLSHQKVGTQCWPVFLTSLSSAGGFLGREEKQIRERFEREGTNIDSGFDQAVEVVALLFRFWNLNGSQRRDFEAKGTHHFVGHQKGHPRDKVGGELKLFFSFQQTPPRGVKLLKRDLQKPTVSST